MSARASRRSRVREGVGDGEDLFAGADLDSAVAPGDADELRAVPASRHRIISLPLKLIGN
jgi:hypothetical protein